MYNIYGIFPKDLANLKIYTKYSVCMSFLGEWLSISVHIAKQFGYKFKDSNVDEKTFTYLEYVKLKNLHYFWIVSCSFSYGFYFTLCGFLHVGIHLLEYYIYSFFSF